MRADQSLIAGVDEVGRGPLAGNVVAAAVILDPSRPIDGLRDSKKLSETKRKALDSEIREHALAFAICEASVEEIDTINILHASLLAMKRSVEALQVQPRHVLVDGNRLPNWAYSAEPVVGGDDIHAEIAAASILAKVYRDAQMLELHRQYPEYGLDRHKGYPTKLHLERLAEHGPTIYHRKSFAPVKRFLSQ